MFVSVLQRNYPLPADGVSPIQQISGSVLIVDDEPAIRRLAAAILRKHGIQVFEAATGSEAIDYLSANGVDIRVMLLDLAMPQMNGGEALCAIAKLRPDVRVIVSSGYSDACVRQQFGQTEFRSFLPKPYTSEQLLEQVLPALNA